MEIKSREIKITPIAEIKLNPKNRNKHPVDQIERLADIIKYQGFRNPLIVSNRTGLLVAGHGRLEAAKLLSLSEVPVIYQDFENEDQEYACGISDNSIGAWAELDMSGINFDVPELGPDFDIEMLGIKDFVLDMSEKIADINISNDINESWSFIIRCADHTELQKVKDFFGVETNKVFLKTLENIIK